MAMTNCKECKTKISNKAESCPQCGAPNTKKTKDSSVGCGSLLVILIAIGFIGSQISQCNTENERQAQQQRIDAASQAAALARKAELEQFISDPAATLEKAEALSEQSRWRDVVQLLEPFLPAQNEKAQHLYNNALEQSLVSELAKIPASNAKANFHRYDRLVKLRPENPTYKEKRDRYKARWEEQQAKEVAEALIYGSRPVKSEWDGSYPEVKTYLKLTAHDPDSIEFVGCTDLFKNPDGWVVGCQYRGNNAFGGKILTANWFRIQSGVVVQVYDADAFKW